MKLSKKELIDHLNQYPDDYELNLSHYFLVEGTPSTKGKNKGKPKFMQAQVNLPIVGTAADKDNKEIRFVLNSSNEDVLKRIEEGNVHPIQQKTEAAEEPVEEPVEEKKAATAV
jgi:hypothetical protein